MKKFTIFTAILATAGIGFFGKDFLSEDGTWLCKSSAWNFYGNPSDGIPTEPCDGIKTIYLDVRRDDEWNAGHIKGAIHFDVARLQAGELPDISKDSNLQIYCKSGNRAEIAKKILDKAGFIGAVNAGGIEILYANGLPRE